MHTTTSVSVRHWQDPIFGIAALQLTGRFISQCLISADGQVQLSVSHFSSQTGSALSVSLQLTGSALSVSLQLTDRFSSQCYGQAVWRGKTTVGKEEKSPFPFSHWHWGKGREGTIHTVIACTVGGVGGYIDPLNNPSHKAVVWGCCQWDGWWRWQIALSVCARREQSSVQCAHDCQCHFS